MHTSNGSDIVKSATWTHEQLHDQTVTLQGHAGQQFAAKFTAVPCRHGMRVLVSYALGNGEAAVRPVTQQEIDKIHLFPGGPTKFKMF